MLQRTAASLAVFGLWRSFKASVSGGRYCRRRSLSVTLAHMSANWPSEWRYWADYAPDISAALERLREDVFARGGPVCISTSSAPRHSGRASGVSMHQYLRIIVDAAPENYSESERRRLRDCITSAPGITEVKTITRHPKGGYSITAELAGDTAAQIGSHLESCGYRLAL